MTLSVRAPLTIILSVPRPKLLLAVTSSATARLTLTLRDAKRHTVAVWTVRVLKGRHTLRLALPAAARHRGVHTLRIVTLGGGPTKTLRLLMK
jgi:hypothetical protein